ncbi:Hypothetical protein D9617_38g090890 [Elsinoe fawcettii]|nr:Hypothetical protein D9617_38g090890 [Elsinoe fawcettii]
MRSIAYFTAALVATSAAAVFERQSSSSSALGESCSRNGDCPAGSYCYNNPPLTPSAPTAVPVCGGFNATCTSDINCALNTCNNGLCNGYKGGLSSSTSTSSAATPTSTVALGGQCSRNGDCPAGVYCYNNPPLTPSAPTAVPLCGGFNATCTNDSECALNTCNKGVCNGYKGGLSSSSTSSSAAASSMTTTAAASSSAASSSALPSSSSVSAPPKSASSVAPPPPVTSVVTYAAAGVGQPCEVDAQCPTGVQCLNNPPLTPSAPVAAKICGGFNATCSSDEQCAMNTCNKNLCNGYKSSSTNATTTTVTTAGSGSRPTSSASGTRSSASASVVSFPGAGNREGVNTALLLAAGALVYMV